MKGRERGRIVLCGGGGSADEVAVSRCPEKFKEIGKEGGTH
jgi:general stress protein YciG